MRALVGWIAGIFALGLALGGLYGSNFELQEEPSIAELPTVDCGSGREALLEPVTVNGTKTLRVKCVSIAAPAPASATPVPAPVQVPVATVNHERDSQPAHPVRRESDARSWKNSALIIGSSAGAGAGIGALAKGKKGAIVGAAVGGVAGTVYDLTTRNKK